MEEEKKIKTNCHICSSEIEINETALELCEKCFNQKCTCGHIRGKHVDDTGSCIHQYDWRHNNECCKCEKFVLAEEPPAELTTHNVIYWSEHWKKLVVEGGEDAKGQKAKKFIENNCIEYVKKEDSETGKGYYICKPIPDYNKTTHRITNSSDGSFECSCQEYQTYKRPCSHIIALYLQLKIWNWNKKNLKKDNIEMI
jgi:hypothetical protein